MTRLALTGQHGQVARALAELAPPEITLVPLARPDFDLADPATFAPALDTSKPDAILSVAAYTAVDEAESDRDTAHAVNATAPGLLGAEAARRNIPILHLSTDYVFDGTKGDWREEDPPAPLGVYGASKLAGERAVAAATPNHMILRTAWVISPFGRNFARTILNAARTRPALSVVDDQHGNPTSAHEIARALLLLAPRLIADPSPALRGTFHMSAEGQTTWAGLARALIAEAGLSTPVTPIATADWPTPATRPAYSTLAGSKLARIHGLRLADWRDTLPGIVTRIMGEST